MRGAWLEWLATVVYCLVPVVALAQQVPPPTASPSSPPLGMNITIQVDIDGLVEMEQWVEQAMDMQRQQLQGVDITEAQRNHISALTAQMQALQQTLPQTIQLVERSAKTIVDQAVVQARQQAVEPTLQQINAYIQSWLLRLGLGGVLVVVIIGVIVYLSTRQLRLASRNLSKISLDYRIVHTDHLQALSRAQQEQSQEGTSTWRAKGKA